MNSSRRSCFMLLVGWTSLVLTPKGRNAPDESSADLSIVTLLFHIRKFSGFKSGPTDGLYLSRVLWFSSVSPDKLPE
jgi:hypothetical protein